MTKAEFLQKLKTSLGNDLNRSIVQENVDFYNGYIDDEVRKGRSEAEVIEELGDPWVLAQTIIDGEENGRGSGSVEGSYREADSGYSNEYDEDYAKRERSRGTSDHGSSMRHSGGLLDFLGFDTWWKKVLLLLGIIGIVVLVVAIVGSMLTILAPIMIPLLIIMLIVRLLGDR